MVTLPTPSWLTLREALDWLIERGATEEAVKLVLPRAFRNGEIQTRGRCYLFFNHNMQVKIPDYVWDKTIVFWDLNKFETRLFISSAINFEDIEVFLEELREWAIFDKEEDILGQLTDNTLPTGNLRAELPEYRSPYMELMLAAETHFGNRLRPGTPAKKDEIEDWLEKNWLEFITSDRSDNLIRHMATLIRDPVLRKGGNKKLG